MAILLFGVAAQRVGVLGGLAGQLGVPSPMDGVFELLAKL
jgi:hypothetical protein